MSSCPLGKKKATITSNDPTPKNHQASREHQTRRGDNLKPVTVGDTAPFKRAMSKFHTTRSDAEDAELAQATASEK